MKKALKILGILLGVIVLVALGAFVFINSSGIPAYEPGNIDLTVQSTPERIERGHKMVSLLCANCHMNSETGKLSGKHMSDAPPEFGTIYSANITQHPEFGIGTYTDGELIYLLRTGIKRDGKYSPPWMAKLPNMADEDIHAIISFLRSDDPMVAADPTSAPKSIPSFLTKLLCRIAFKPLPYPTEVITLPDTTETIALGRYYTHNLDCYTCHSADFKTMNMLHPELSEGYMGGGNTMLNLEGKAIQTQNITPDEETGIGKWTEEQFVRAVKYGLKDGEEALRYPMVPFTNLTDLEARAIYQYLRTVPPLKNKVGRTVIE